MARSRFCKSCQGWHDLAEPWPVECLGHFGIKDPGPQIISDTIEPFRSLATGEVFSSKSRYRADLRARGLIEVGNDRGGFGKPPGYQAGDLAGDIKRTIAELSRGY